MLRRVAVLGVVVLVGCGTVEGSVRPEPDGAGRTVVLRSRPGPAVALSDAEFAAAMSWLTEDLRVLPQESRTGCVAPASLEPDTSRGLSLAQAEQLRQGYEAWCAAQNKGPDCKEILGGGGFTADAKDALAIAIALASAWGGVRDEALSALSPERLTTLITTALMSYTVLWTLPEPTSKSVAAGFTVVLWGYLGREFLGFVSAWLDMKKEVSAATTFPEVRAAGERFGHRMGQKTLRLVVMVATAIFTPKGSFEATVTELPGYAESAVVPGLGAGETLAAVGGDAQLAVVSQGHLEIALQTGWAASSVVGDLTGTGSAPGGPPFAPNKAAPVKEPNSKPPEPQNPDKKPQAEKGANEEPPPLTGRPPGFKAYSSHKSFKRAMGSPGEGNEWHHLVEQTPSNVKRFGAKEIHNTVNEVKLEAKIHRKVSGLYSSKQEFLTNSPNKTVREWLSSQSYEEQRQFGLLAIEKVKKGEW